VRIYENSLKRNYYDNRHRENKIKNPQILVVLNKEIKNIKHEARQNYVQRRIKQNLLSKN